MAMGKLHQFNAGLKKQVEAAWARPLHAPPAPAPVEIEEGDQLVWEDADLVLDNPYQPRKRRKAEAMRQMVEDLNRDG